MRVARALLVALVCLGFTPGLGELISDSVHLLQSGHSHHGGHGHHEHASAHDVHDAHDVDGHHAGGDGHHGEPEHGCSGTQHSCPCHTSLSIAPVVVPADVPGADLTTLGLPLPITEQGPTGVRMPLDHPPRA